MIVPGSVNPLLWTTEKSYYKSLRVSSSRNTWLSRTPSASGDRTTNTLSVWVKRSLLSSTQVIFSGSGGQRGSLYFSYTDKLTFDAFGSSAELQSTAAYRDPAAWLHVVFVIDTNNPNGSERYRAYVNGERVATSSYSTPALGSSPQYNDGTEHAFGRDNEAITRYFDGYFCRPAFVDGQALNPSYFGEKDASTGQWVPKSNSAVKAVVDAGGANSFYLTFENTSTLSNLAIDTSSKGNNWTANNVSLTGGASYDSMHDTPTNNFATFNPLQRYDSSSYNGTYSNANLVVSAPGYPTHAFATMAIPPDTSIGWYWEGVCTSMDVNRTYIGICYPPDGPFSSLASYAFNSKAVLNQDGNFWSTSTNSGAADATFTSYTANDVMMVAYKSGKLWIGKNGTWMNGGNPAAGTGALTSALSTVKEWLPYFGYNSTWSVNFGQRPFSYEPPAGFKTLCTDNLSIPAINNPATVFDIYSYSGTGSSLAIGASSSVSPDLVWVMRRDSGANANMFNAISGVGKYLSTNSYGTETTDASSLTSFNGNGVTLGGSSAANTSGGSYIAWAWDTGSSTVSNTSGSITSQVRANPTAGVSIVQFTGTLAAATIGHGLSSAPQMIITKPLQATTTVDHWQVYHSSLGPTKFLTMSNTDAAVTYPTRWNDTYPTASVFTVGSAFDTRPYLAICFSEVPGFSKMGSYVGNGSADGPFFYCGFRPRWVLLKSSTSATYWMVFDTTRDGSNIMSGQIYPNTATAESAVATLDIVSNGFKLRYTGGYGNDPGQTYVVLAFAEAPYKYALAR